MRKFFVLFLLLAMLLGAGEAIANADANAEVEAETEVEAEVEAEAEADANADVEVETEADAEVETEAEADANADAETGTEADSNVLAAMTEVDGGYVTSGGAAYKLYRGVFNFPSEVAIGGAMKDIPAVFFFSEGFFAEDPYVYSNHLAAASLCMAMAGFYSNEGATGPDADYSNKNKNIRRYMRDIGVAEADIYVNYYNTVRPQTDSIGVTIGKRNLASGDVLIPIAIRGSNYEREWTSNVTLGTEQNNDGEAQGFSSAAQIVFSEIQKYISQKNLSAEIDSGNVIFWIAGYSRAGATANLTAKRLVDAYASSGNKVFAYCVEAPMGGWQAAEKSGADYNCIHSVINRNDIVPRVAPGFMNFKRYGVDHYLPGSSAGAVTAGADGNKHDNEFYKTDTASYISIHEKMLTQLVVINNNFAFDDAFTVWGLDLRLLRTNLLFREGEKMYMDDFLDEFVKNLCAWTNMTREHYTAKNAHDLDMGYLIDGNIQGALRDCMAIIYGSRTEETKAFIEYLKSFWREAGLNKWKELAELIIYPLRKWTEPQWPYKEYYIKKAVRWLDDSNCFMPLDLPAPEKEKLLRVDMPILMQFVLDYGATDYQQELHGTSGLSQILTFLANARNIGMNHYPEVTLAWLRAQDSLYDNETLKPSAAAAANFNANAKAHAASASDKIIIGFDEIPDMFIEHGVNEILLPKSTRVYYLDGTSENADIDWELKTKFYVHEDPNDDTSGWVELDDYAEPAPVEPMMWVTKGLIMPPYYAGIAEDVDTSVACRVYQAGIPDLPVPSASLPVGEYAGAQTVTLSTDIAGCEIYYCVSASSADMEPNQKYTGPIVIGDNVTASADFILIAYAKGNGTSWDDSDAAVWEYTILPLEGADDADDADAQVTSSNNGSGGCDNMRYAEIYLAVVLFAVALLRRKLR
ncbi:MAG: chitobiase/beta-hexosaminidase C-terminal domain-containing protein [Synergistaceae bacterium]|nr:chitobiase/beta-hexosaminidase C-terminal domain-containing protein [Synergistaceae bacterium]